jgi:Ca-activated chloride channel homolog
MLVWGGDGGQDQQTVVNLTPRARPTPSGRPSPSLRVNVQVILVPVTVTDAMNKPVQALSQERFRVLEDGVEQKITSFSQEEAPISMGLLFDTSNSMKNRLESSIEAMKLLFQTTMPGDEFFLVQFSDKAKLLSPFTPEPEQIFHKLGFVQAAGWTALLDSIAMGTNHMRNARNAGRVLLILSDGEDNNSRFTESEIRNMVVESDLRVYGLALLNRPRFLQKLAEQTGGDVLLVQNMSELPGAVERLSREIRSQYLIGYSSTNPERDAKYRKVKIELLLPPGTPSLHASWRRGYYAPGE